MYSLKNKIALAGVSQWIECPPVKQKGHRFNSQSGHMPGLQARFPSWEHLRGNQLMYLSHIDLSLPLSPFLPLSLRSK